MSKPPYVLGMGKQELLLESRVMPASGAFGWAPSSSSLGGAGAFVTPEMYLEPSRGDVQRRLRVFSGGVIVCPGDYNPGLRRAHRKYARDWCGLGVPIIAALRLEHDDVYDVVDWFSRDRTFAAIELHPVSTRELSRSLRVLTERLDLPVIVRLAAMCAPEMAVEAEAGGAAGLVCAAPLPAFSTDTGRQGELHGSAFWPFCAELFLRVQEVTSLPLIARGGIDCCENAMWYLNSGAAAVQVDTLCYRDPNALVDIADEIAKAN